MLDYIQREGFTELIISTPGPIGITALLAAKVLGIRASGIYHTDFPQYIRILTDDSFLETLTWTYMQWFYDALDLIYVNSEGYRTAWIDRGIAAEKLCILPRGLDSALFSPTRRDPDFWVKRGARRDATVLLYVGRVSKEKDLDVIVQAWPRLKAAINPQPSTINLQLAFVGDGPYRAELERMLLAFWGRRLGLTNLDPSQALAEMRRHAEAGRLIEQLERWLHRPDTADQVDVSALLGPYRENLEHDHATDGQHRRNK